MWLKNFDQHLGVNFCQPLKVRLFLKNGILRHIDNAIQSMHTVQALALLVGDQICPTPDAGSDRDMQVEVILNTLRCQLSGLSIQLVQAIKIDKLIGGY